LVIAKIGSKNAFSTIGKLSQQRSKAPYVFIMSYAFALCSFFALEALTTQLTQLNTCVRVQSASEAMIPSSGVSGLNQSFTDQSASISRLLA